MASEDILLNLLVKAETAGLSDVTEKERLLTSVYELQAKALSVVEGVLAKVEAQNQLKLSAADKMVVKMAQEQGLLGGLANQLREQIELKDQIIRRDAMLAAVDRAVNPSGPRRPMPTDASGVQVGSDAQNNAAREAAERQLNADIVAGARARVAEEEAAERQRLQTIKEVNAQEDADYKRLAASLVAQRREMDAQAAAGARTWQAEQKTMGDENLARAKVHAAEQEKITQTLSQAKVKAMQEYAAGTEVAGAKAEAAEKKEAEQQAKLAEDARRAGMSTQQYQKAVNEETERAATAHAKAAAGIVDHTEKQKGLHGALGNVEGALKGVTSGLAGMAENLLKATAQAGPLALVLGGAGIAGIIGKLVEDTVKWDSGILSLTATMNGNAVAASQMAAFGNLFGISTEQMTTRMSMLSRRMVESAQQLNDLGVATKTADGHLLTLEQTTRLILERMQQLGDSSERTALVAVAFGRGVGQLEGALVAASMPIKVTADNINLLGGNLGDTRMAYDLIIARANQLGLVLNNQGLAGNLAFDSSLKEMNMSIKGLEISIGHALMPIISAFAQGLTNFIANHLQQFIAGLTTLIGWIYGVMHAFFGVTLSLDEFNKAIMASAAVQGDNSAALETGKEKKNDLKAANLAAKESEDALVVSIRHEIDANTDAKKAIDTQIDAQIKQIDQTIKQIDAARTLRDAQRRLADDQLNVAKEQSKLQKDLSEGNAVAATADSEQLSKDQIKLGDDTLSAKEDQEKAKLTAHKDSLSEEKNADDAYYSDLITKENDALSNARENYQARTLAAQQAAAAAQSAATTADANIAGAANLTSTQIDGMFQDAMTRLNGIMSGGGSQAGQSFGEGIKNAVALVTQLFTTGSMSKAIDMEMDLIKASVDLGLADMLHQVTGNPLGYLLIPPAGMAVAVATENYLRNQARGLTGKADNLLGQVRDDLAASMQTTSTYSGPHPTAGFRALGGPVWAGQSYVVGDGGKPEVFTPNQSGNISPMDSGSSNVFNINVTAGADAERISMAIKREVVNALTSVGSS